MVGVEDSLIKNKRINAGGLQSSAIPALFAEQCAIPCCAATTTLRGRPLVPAPSSGVNVLVAAVPSGGIEVLTVAAPGGSVDVLAEAAPSGGISVLAAATPSGDIRVLAVAAPGSSDGAAGVVPAPGRNAHHRAQAARKNAQQNVAAVAVGCNPAPTTILTNTDAEQIQRGCSIDLGGTVSSPNGLLEHTQLMINSTINTGVRSSLTINAGVRSRSNVVMSDCCYGRHSALRMQRGRALMNW